MDGPLKALFLLGRHEGVTEVKMERTTYQMDKWSGKFGRDYTDRNDLSVEKLDDLYRGNYGKTRTQLNSEFLKGFDFSMRILEVGSNLGVQLACLQRMGFTELYGIELQDYAVELSKSRTKSINIIKGSATDIPYKDQYFDIVFTSGVLIHIPPFDLNTVMSEIHRCTKNYIWGFEYYAEKHVEVPYRSNDNLLWKGDFGDMYLNLFKDLRLIRQEHLKYVTGENVDAMFLLAKR
jgi:pseudaminic acid biosynthesis-associated methylase